MPPWRVAIIGGGSAGVATARAMLAAGHLPTLFESRSSLGGIWAVNEPSELLYDGLTTNLPTSVMRSDLAPPFPESAPSFVEAEALGAHIEAYAEKHALMTDPRSTIKLGTKVLSVRPVEEPSPWQTLWEVRCDTDEARGATFDAVVVATGHYNKAYEPAIPGVDAWIAAAPHRREVVHSSAYRRPGQFEFRNVLVVGARASGADIARELAARRGGEHTSLLDSSCAAPRRSRDGACTHVPRGCALTSDGRLTWPSPTDDDAARAALESAPPIDTVILATGYVYDFPFLDADSQISAGGRFVDPLFLHTISAAKPTLAFVGIPLAVPVPIPLFEAQAKFVASQWSAARAGRTGTHSDACDAQLGRAAERAEAAGAAAARRLAAPPPRALSVGTKVHRLRGGDSPQWCADVARVRAVHRGDSDAEEAYYTVELEASGREVNTLASRLRVREGIIDSTHDDAVHAGVDLDVAMNASAAAARTTTIDRATRFDWIAKRMRAVDFDSRPQDLHNIMAGGDDAWKYIRLLSVLAGRDDGSGAPLDDAALAALCRRLAIVRDVYLDVSNRRKGGGDAHSEALDDALFSWQSDDYRRYEYNVDWAAGCWSVAFRGDSDATLRIADAPTPRAKL